jgi:hypothetical protein
MSTISADLNAFHVIVYSDRNVINYLCFEPLIYHLINYITAHPAYTIYTYTVLHHRLGWGYFVLWVTPIRP